MVGDFVQYPSIRANLMFFSWLDRGYGFGEEDRRGEVSSSHPGQRLSTRCITDGVDLDHLTQVAFARFLLSSSFSFSYSLWKPVAKCSPIKGRGS